MSFFIMLPDGTTGTNEWTNVGGSSFHESVQSDDNASSYIYETRSGHEITFTMADPGVAEGTIDFDSDVTVQAFATANYYSGGAGTIDMTIGPTGTGISLPTTTVTVVVNASFPSYNSNGTTFKSIGNPWDYGGLENVQVKLDCTGTPARFTQLRVSYVYVRVDYTQTGISVLKDNATFYGANF
jgi:hypothetical protein